MAIPDEEVARVRDATDLASLVGEHTALKRVGRRLVGLCPFHPERTPSFSVNPEQGLYYCFGCQASGDAISFVRQVHGCDFAEAVELLAARAGIAIRHEEGPRARSARDEREALYDALARAVAFYHEKLLADDDARAARAYLRRRGYDAQVVRGFRLGWAPEGWDVLSSRLGVPEPTLVAAGLAYRNARGRLQDVFRSRVVFPIFDPGGRAIALGGRVLPPPYASPGAEAEPKYRNSAESAIYAKRRTLYGLNWAREGIVREGEAVVCEGYTDVIGFFGAGVPRAVATCGTALTEDHLRIVSRYAKRVVLAFDADRAGQSATERVYEWERRFDLEVAVAELPEGSDPADVAREDPGALRAAVAAARPLLEFRVRRAFAVSDLRSPEARARAAEAAMAAVAEHPSELVRDQYVVLVADLARLDPATLRAALPGAAHRFRASGSRDPEPVADDARGTGPVQRAGVAGQDERPPRLGVRGRRAERDALLLAVHEPATMAPWLDECLFADETHRVAFRVLAEATDLHEAIAAAPPAAAALVRQLAVEEPEAEPFGTVLQLVRAAAERALARLETEARALDAGDVEGPPEALAGLQRRLAWLKRQLEVLREAGVDGTGRGGVREATEALLAWLRRADGEGA